MTERLDPEMMRVADPLIRKVFAAIEEGPSDDPSPIEACLAAGHAASATLPFDQGNLVLAACKQVADEYADWCGGRVEPEKVTDRINWWLAQPDRLRELRIKRGMVH